MDVEATAHLILLERGRRLLQISSDYNAILTEYDQGFDKKRSVGLL